MAGTMTLAEFLDAFEEAVRIVPHVIAEGGRPSQLRFWVTDRQLSGIPGRARMFDPITFTLFGRTGIILGILAVDRAGALLGLDLPDVLDLCDASDTAAWRGTRSPLRAAGAEALRAQLEERMRRALTPPPIRGETEIL